MIFVTGDLEKKWKEEGKKEEDVVEGVSVVNSHGNDVIKAKHKKISK